MKIKSKIFFSLMILFGTIAFFAGLFLIIQVEELAFACFIDGHESMLQGWLDADINCSEDKFMENSIIWIVGTGAYLYLMLYLTDFAQIEWKKRRWL